MATRIEDIAEAYRIIAEVNHYMVGIAHNPARAPITTEELEEARGWLITLQNLWAEGSPIWKRLNLALDLIDRDIAERNKR
jgi:hypothetical protein